MYILSKISYLVPKNYFSSYAAFQVYGIFQRTFNIFSGVVFILYRGHCFDGMVVSLNLMIAQIKLFNPLLKNFIIISLKPYSWVKIIHIT